MFRNMLWCYVFLLTLLDLSLKTKLTAQGDSHGVSIHDSFVEGITFQEWDQEAGAEGAVDANDESVEGVWTWPRALRFGRMPLGAAHTRSVTITNRANTTLHLASVAGTTPDFHASFFDSKTLAPGGNTTFSVVYLGRREGPVTANLYLHTSLGVHKYSVSAVGEASPFDVWPLVGLRVPINATLESELTLFNPTDSTIQVYEVYSTSEWLGLLLPAGEEHAPRAAWAVPPRERRTLVRLRVALPPHTLHPLTAYVSLLRRRVKADLPGGGLLLAVEARPVPAGEHARPLHVRLGSRGSGDGTHTVELELANSADTDLVLEGYVSGAGCWRGAPPSPCTATPDVRINGGGSPGARLSLLRSKFSPHQNFVKAAQLTLNYGELWAAGSLDGAAEAWCVGCVRLGYTLVPYSVRLLPGTLRFTPPQLDVVTASADATRETELRAHNEFARPMRVLALTLPDDVAMYFKMVSNAPLTLAAGGSAVVARLLLRERTLPPEVSVSTALLVYTDVALYRVPLRLYSGRMLFEWEWWHSTNSRLQLGTLGMSTTRRVGVRLRNPAPVQLCIGALGARLPGAAATFARAAPAPSCVEPGAWAHAWLTVVAPAREGELRGELQLNTSAPHATCNTAIVTMRVRAGNTRLLPLRMPPAAPYADSRAALEAQSTMEVDMFVLGLSVQMRSDGPAISFEWGTENTGRVLPGVSRVALIKHSPHRRCEPNSCYCGLPDGTDEAAEWLRRSEALDGAALLEDLALLNVRLALFERQRAEVDTNFTLLVQTDEMRQMEVAGTAPLAWPRFAAEGAGRVSLATVGSESNLRVPIRNDAYVPVLLQAIIGLEPYALPDLPDRAGGATQCAAGRCDSTADVFRLTGWRVVSGSAKPWNASHTNNETTLVMPLLLLAPHTELEITIMFTPKYPGSFASYMYLRNNLTILEGVQLTGEGAYPKFELSGRRPGSNSPLLIEVSKCTWDTGMTLSRRLVVRNTGWVEVQLSNWSVAGEGCEARGFSLRPCGTRFLKPNKTLGLYVDFTPDFTLARVSAPLAVRSERGTAEFLLLATVPAKVLAQCAAEAPRPPFERAMRFLGICIAFIALMIVLSTASLDAENLMKRARAARAAAAPRAALDLRTLSEPVPPAAPAARAPPRRRRAARRPMPALDPRAERRAFERWRAQVLRRTDESSRSSDDDDDAAAPNARCPEPAARPADEDVLSSGSDGSTAADERDDEPYSADVEPDAPDDDARDDEPHAPAAPPAECALAATPTPGEVRTRSRRDASDAARRPERARLDSERRSAPSRLHVRKERATKRRAERVPPTPPPRSPAPTAPPAEREAVEARGAVRPWASWSSVVAAGGAGAMLAPIGSDVRRREPERVPDNSLFYFNGTAADTTRDSFAWRPALPEPPVYGAPAGDGYLEGNRSLSAAVPFGAATSVWGSWGVWPAVPVRPPPGFAPPAPAPAPPPLETRTYDPFRSLASIWAPAPNEWRASPGSPSSEDQRENLD